MLGLLAVGGLGSLSDSHFKGDEKTEWARCDLFSGKEVKATGWCKVWVKKG